MNINVLGGSYTSTYSRANSTNVSSPVQSSSTDTTKAGNSVSTASTNGVIVNISNSGKSASTQATEQLSFKDVGMGARAKLDALKQQAAVKTGTTANLVNVQQKDLIDYSSFSDQELAAMSLNSSGNFSKDERDEAQGWLGERTRISLEAYTGATNSGDLRGQTMAINALYDGMTPEVRSALGWTPAMMAMNNHLLSWAEGIYGKLDISGVLTNLQTAQAHGGLTFHAGGAAL
jgi:hypothetical protein